MGRSGKAAPQQAGYGQCRQRFSPKRYTYNVWVLSVSPKEHECNPREITGNNYVPELDKRRVLPNPQAQQDIGLCDFKLDEFKRDVKTKTVNELLANPANQAKVDKW
ncbi:MAG: hypothetical protein ACH34X_14515 [Thiolinea sp.]